MKGIWNYMSPLVTFIVGMIFTLLITIFFPAIHTAQVGLSSNAAVSSGAYWGLREAITNTRLIVFLACFAVTLFLVAKSWLARRG